MKTKSKIRFVQPRGDKEKAAKKMNEMFHPNTIDSDMGGRVDATWDIDEYQSVFTEVRRGQKEACLKCSLLEENRMNSERVFKKRVRYTRIIYIPVSSSLFVVHLTDKFYVFFCLIER